MPFRSNPLPLSWQQLLAVGSSAWRELAWGLPELRRRTGDWRQLAEQIPDEPIRRDALETFERKRGNTAGAGIFATIPRRRSTDLLRALVAFQTIFDFLDDLHERHPTAANARLYDALVDAVTPTQPVKDYYAEHPWRGDGGYLEALVKSSQAHCASLPSFGAVAMLLNREAQRAAAVLAMNHTPDPEERIEVLQQWAARVPSTGGDWRWFELTAAASGQLAMFSLIAMAAEPGIQAEEVERTYRAYWPVVPLLTTMLDSFVDQESDQARGAHRYVAYYGESDAATERLAELIRRAGGELRTLPCGQRHAVIFSCMIGFYLAKESARSPALTEGTRQLIEAGGSLTRTLAPVLRMWRIAYGQQKA